jgi:hypothetical protein
MQLSSLNFALLALFVMLFVTSAAPVSDLVARYVSDGRLKTSFTCLCRRSHLRNMSYDKLPRNYPKKRALTSLLRTMFLRPSTTCATRRPNLTACSPLFHTATTTMQRPKPLISSPTIGTANCLLGWRISNGLRSFQKLSSMPTRLRYHRCWPIRYANVVQQLPLHNGQSALT